jgi:glycosyltransferase involved in cell wall biosynthesis
LTRISVVIPAYNAAHFIGDALRSVFAQDVQAHEVIVVDDGSTDSTVNVASEFVAATVLEGPHQGVSSARNRGVGYAIGDLIAFLDADDTWAPSKLRKQLELLNSERLAGIAISRQAYLFEGPIPTWFRGPTDGGSEVGTQPSNWLIRRECWERVGPFRTDLTHSEDTDWWARAADLGEQWVLVDEPLVIHRIHGGNASANAPAVAEGVLRALRLSVARKRGTS